MRTLRRVTASDARGLLGSLLSREAISTGVARGSPWAPPLTSVASTFRGRQQHSAFHRAALQDIAGPRSTPALRAMSSRAAQSADSAVMADINKEGLAQWLTGSLKNRDVLKTAALVGGNWVSPGDVVDGSPVSGTFPVLNPATGKAIAVMPELGTHATESAVRAAHDAFGPWSAMLAKEREKVMRKWHDLIVENRDDVATIMSAECGKPFREALLEIDAGLASITWCAEEGKRVNGKVIKPTVQNKRMLVIKQPVGVVGAITPWNFPFSMITRKVSPALAAGCTVVLKPANETPLTAVAVAELARKAGMPDGVLNIVFGVTPEIGDVLPTSPLVSKIGFTGSTAVGKMLAAKAMGTMKRISMELGGNAPSIVFADADLDLAARATVGSALRNAGQTCICANRILVQEPVYDAFAKKVAEIVSKIRVGPGLSPGTHMGPLIRAKEVERADQLVKDAVSKGAKLLYGGQRPQLTGEAANGNFYLPTVLTGVTTDMRCYLEEQFAPLVPLTSFRTEDEAAEMANDTVYGLTAYMFTRDLNRTWKFAERLQYGMVGVNEVAIVSEAAPFGGWKESGVGRENGSEAIEYFLETKYICMGLEA